MEIKQSIIARPMIKPLTMESDDSDQYLQCLRRFHDALESHIRTLLSLGFATIFDIN